MRRIITICDRCGARTEPRPPQERQPDGWGYLDSQHLCGPCYGEFGRFMDGEPLKGRATTWVLYGDGKPLGSSSDYNYMLCELKLERAIRRYTDLEIRPE